MTDRLSRRRSLVLLSALIVMLLYLGYKGGVGDFDFFYIASRQFLHRLNPYDPTAYHSGTPFGLPNPPLSFLLTLIPSMLPMNIARGLWDLICLLMWVPCIFMWVKIIWKEQTDVSEFVQITVASAIAPLQWSFASHQIIIPVLLFSTVACWTHHKKYSPFWTGLAAGAMLMKPHLVLLLVVALFFKSQKKTLFIAGLCLAFTIPYIPFFNTVRPITDLKDWMHTMKQFGQQIYCADEQGIISRALPLLRPRVSGQDIVKTGSCPGVVVSKNSGDIISRIKSLAWIFGFLTWAVWWSRHRSISDTTLFASSLAWGLLISIYSHLYDGVLLTPLFLIGLHRGMRKIALQDLFGLLFVLNLLVAWVLICLPRIEPYEWQMMGWASFFYTALCLSMIYSGSQSRIEKPG